MNMRSQTRYSETVKAMMVAAAKAAATDAEIARLIGASSSTIRRWKSQHPDLAEALAKARLPPDAPEQLSKLEQRKARAEKMLDDYLETGAELRIVQDGDGLGSYTKTQYKLLPDRWLLERILGPAEKVSEDFEVRISIAAPELDDDEDDETFDDDDDDI